MLVLHLVADTETTYAWAETDTQSDQTPTAMHPFSTSQKQLNSELQKAGVTSHNSAATYITLNLPTSHGYPMASTPILGQKDRKRQPQTQHWQVPALVLSGNNLLRFLERHGPTRTQNPGIINAPDTTFWSHALQFALSLTARQQFIPHVASEARRHTASWKPAVAGADLLDLHRLIHNMPPSAYAVVSDNEQTNDAETVLRNTIHRIVDALVTPSARKHMPQPTHREDRRIETHSTHQAWTNGLAHLPSRRISGTHDDREHIEAQYNQWKHPLDLVAQAPARLCFRLEEPEVIDQTDEFDNDAPNSQAPPEQPAWFLRYLIQPNDDPSALIPADHVWQGQSQLLNPVNNQQHLEFMLTSLVNAGTIVEPIAQSLEHTQPNGVTLSVGAAHQFLTTEASPLHEAGYGVMLPAWWTRKGTKNRLTTRAVVKNSPFSSGSGSTLDQLMEFHWEASLDGEALTLDELRQLAAIKAPLARFRGRWLDMTTNDIAQAIDHWNSQPADTITARDLLKMQLTAQNAPDDATFAGVTADGWINDLIKQLTNQQLMPQAKIPDRLKAQLRPYQASGYSWLSFLSSWQLGACLADDMGLGKTLQTLTLLLADQQHGNTIPSLLICPTSVVGNWQREAQNFTPDLSTYIHHGPDRADDAHTLKAELANTTLAITTYGTIQRDHKLLAQIPWRGLILDEAQNIKNPDTNQAQACRSIPATYRVALTGTPVENHVGDLWSIMEFLNPGLLGSKAEFRQHFLRPIQHHQDEDAAERLKSATAPFILRRMKTDPDIRADLPDKFENRVYCSLTREQTTLYAGVIQDLQDQLANTSSQQRSGLVFALTTKLKQVCNHPRQFLGDNSDPQGRSGKMNRLIEMLDQVLANDEKAIVFTQYVEMANIIQSQLHANLGQHAPVYHGQIPRVRRDDIVRQFQDKSSPKVLVVSLKAGGSGLNLTAANHVFHFDRWWNPAVEDQATDRAFRIGQTKDVQVHKFICSGTLEERIDDVIEQKSLVADSMITTGDKWLSTLSNQELHDALKLANHITEY